MWLSLPKAVELSGAQLDFFSLFFFFLLSLFNTLFLYSVFLFNVHAVLARWLRNCECDPQQPAALQIEMMSTQI